jgi:hypothetical protein
MAPRRRRFVARFGYSSEVPLTIAEVVALGGLTSAKVNLRASKPAAIADLATLTATSEYETH